MSEMSDAILQSVTLNQRREIKVCGILSVDSFDEYRICATSHDGAAVVVEGLGLTVKEVNLEKSFFEATGNIFGFFYDEKNVQSKGGFIKSLFSKK